MFIKNDSPFPPPKKNPENSEKSPPENLSSDTCIRLWRSTHLPKFQGPAQTSYPCFVKGGDKKIDGWDEENKKKAIFLDKWK